MESNTVLILLVLSLLVILFVISKLNKAIKLLNNRVNIHSSVLKKLKKERDNYEEDEEGDDVLQNILNHEFGGLK